jgi:predicted ATPase
MRLDKLSIGSPKDSPSHQFKNLKDVTIDFDQDHWVTVVIGWNGTGKSNVLEALAIIFRELISPKKTPKIDFAFNLSYRIGTESNIAHIQIDHDPDRKEPFLIQAESTPIKLNAFLKNESYLPRYVFSYYSGESQRMHDVFEPYLKWYDDQLRGGKDPGLKRLFYALPVHSQYVLLAFLIHQNDDVKKFLKEHLGLDPEDGLESVLFVLRQPPWKPNSSGDPRFWGAIGVVSQFLSKLYDIALAPIEVTRKVPVSLWNSKTLQFKYLYVKDMQALKNLVGKQTPAEFFRDLESTYVSQLIEEVRIKVKLKKNDGTVTFRELSEGEQQLLTVLGLMRFTAENETLFLLDEPDTHLNPRWSVDYLNYLKDFVGKSADGEETSHVVLTTHNPLAVAELLKEQVQILVRDKDNLKISAQPPDIHPRGMGYAGIITSDLFGLESALDSHTLALLEEKRKISAQEGEITEQHRARLNELNSELEQYGFKYEMRDPVYTEYLKARYAHEIESTGKQKGTTAISEDPKARAKRLVEKALTKTEDSQ